MAATKYRNRVLILLCLLLVITYLDRICISVAGPRIQAELGIGPLAWGWVTGIFTLSYALFEIPSGALGDRIGPRRVLTRIVVWWSAFTALTGLATGFYPLLFFRFFFGAGEAGAFPNASVAVARWFPVHERGRAFGTWLMASQLGGALTPLLVVPLQVRYGWRASFYVFAVLGIVWSAVWYWWFRDSPREKAGVTPEELEETRDLPANVHRAVDWGLAMRSFNLWTIMGVAFCYIYTYSFFQSWFHTYLVKARGYSEHDLLLSSLPFLIGAAATLSGGIVGNGLVKRYGLRAGRRWIGAASLGVAALCVAGAMVTSHWLGALVLLSLTYGAITFQQPTMFAACLDVGGDCGGAVVGAMNTAAQVGAFTSSLMFGYLVDRYASYNLPFIPMAAFLLIGAWLWLKVDPLVTVNGARSLT